jgi:hypothetical protein
MRLSDSHTEGKSSVGGNSSGDINRGGCTAVVGTVNAVDAAVVAVVGAAVDAEVAALVGTDCTAIDASTAAAFDVGVDAVTSDCADAVLATAVALEADCDAVEGSGGFDEDSCNLASFFLCRGPSKCRFDRYLPPHSPHNEHDQSAPSLMIHFDICVRIDLFSVSEKKAFKAMTH